MSLTRIIEIEQGTQEWHDWRGGLKFSASNAAAWLKESTWKEDTPLRKALEMLDKVGRKNLDRNPNVIRGKRSEDGLRLKICDMYNRMIYPACIERTDRPYIIASLDGLDEMGEQWELKCPAITTFTKYWNALQADPTWHGPPEYVAQQDHQLLAGISISTVNNLVLALTDEELAKAPPELRGAFSQPLVFRRTLTPERAQQMTELYDHWHAELISGNSLPEADPQRDIYMPDESEVAVIKASVEAVNLNRLVEIKKRELKDLETKIDGHVDVIKAAMGEYSGALMPNGMKITIFPKKGTVDAKAALAEYLPPELNLADTLEKFRGESSLQTKVTFPKESKAKATAKAA